MPITTTLAGVASHQLALVRANAKLRVSQSDFDRPFSDSLKVKLWLRIKLEVKIKRKIERFEFRLQRRQGVQGFRPGHQDRRRGRPERRCQQPIARRLHWCH